MNLANRIYNRTGETGQRLLLELYAINNIRPQLVKVEDKELAGSPGFGDRNADKIEIDNAVILP